MMKKQILLMIGLVWALGLIFGRHAQADTELEYEKALFYGGSGNQSGHAVKFGGGRLHIAGTAADSKLLVVSYAMPPAEQPVSNFVWSDDQKASIEVSSAFTDMAAANEGLYVVGSSLVRTSGKKNKEQLSGVLAKFPLNAAAAVKPLWVVHSEFYPAQKEEVFRAVIAAEEKNSTVIYAAGHASSGAHNVTAVLAKYDSNGGLLWSRILGDPGEMNKSAGTELAMLNGCVYVVGFTSAIEKNVEFNALPLSPTLWKYDSSGNQVWRGSVSTQLQPLEAVSGITHGIKVDVAASDDGCLYLTSGKKSTKSSEGNILLLKYDQNGDRVWETEWLAQSPAADGPADNGWALGIAAGKDRLYVAGIAEYKKGETPRHNEDAFLLEVDKDYGSILAAHVEGETNQLENALAVEAVGTDVYVTGVRKPAGGQDKKSASRGADLMLLRYSILPVTTITMDIDQGSSQNLIRPNEKEVAGAILSTEKFNAATQINMDSLTFGRTGNEASWTGCTVKDVDKNGSNDLLCYFKESWTPWKESKSIFQAGDTEGILKGQTLSGQRLIGKDAVKIALSNADAPPPAVSQPLAPPLSTPEPLPVFPEASLAPPPQPPAPEPAPSAPVTPVTEAPVSNTAPTGFISLSTQTTAASRFVLVAEPIGTVSQNNTAESDSAQTQPVLYSGESDSSQSHRGEVLSSPENKASTPGSGLAQAYGSLGSEAFQRGKVSEAIAFYTEALDRKS